MAKLLTLALFVASATFAGASTAPVPEIDATSASAALTLVGGAVLVLRARRNRK